MEDDQNNVNNTFHFDYNSGIFTIPAGKEIVLSSGTFNQIYIKQPVLSTIMVYKKRLDEHLRSQKLDGSIVYSNDYIESKAYLDGDDDWFLLELARHLYSPTDHNKLIATLQELSSHSDSDVIQEILNCFKEFFFRSSQSIRTHLEQRNSIANLMPMVAGMIAKEKLYGTDKQPLE